MSSLCEHLADQGGVLLAAATCLLAVGCVGVALQRSPIHRQRAGEMAILAVLAGLILAYLPLPRYRIADCWSAGLAASDSPPAETTESPPPVIEPVDQPILTEATGEAVRPMPTDLWPSGYSPTADESGVAGETPAEPWEPASIAQAASLPPTIVVPPAPDEDRPTASGTGVAPMTHRAAPALEVRSWLPLAYLAGGLVCLLWLALGRVLLLRMVWSARPPEPWLWEVYQRLAFGPRHRPRLLISDRCTRALSFGLWRPTIVLPADACEADSAHSVAPSSDGPAWGGRGRAGTDAKSGSASPRDSGGLGAHFVRPQPPGACRADRAEALRYVLSHELAHARQRDGWGHLLFNLAFPLLYFHPLYWWIRSRTYLAAELVADDWAAGRTAKESYVEALIALAKGGGRRQLACVGSVRIFGSRSQFYRRMQMLLDRETRLARRCSPRWRLIYPAACLLAVLLVAGAVGVRPAEAQPDEAVAPASDIMAEPAPPGEVKTEAVAQPPEPAAAGGEVAQLKQERDVIRAEREQLEKQLKDLAAAVAELKKELEALKAQGVVWRRGAVTSRTGTAWPTGPSGPAATPAAPGAIIPAPPGAPVLPTQPTPFGAAPPAPPVPAPVPMPPGALLPPATAALVTPVPIEPRFAATTRSTTYFPGASDGRRMPEGTQLDLVSLATSYADAVGEVEIAKLEYESRKQLAERNTIPAQELAIAQIKFKTAERKVALLRSIAEAALMETKADMDAARSQLESVGKGRPDDRSAIRAAEAQVIRAESRLRVLESILASGGR